MATQLVLPSDASSETFPNNRMGLFDVLLKEPIINEGDQYVALSHISLPRDLIALAEEDRIFSVYVVHARPAEGEDDISEDDDDDEQANIAEIDVNADVGDVNAVEVHNESGDEETAATNDPFDYARDSTYLATGTRPTRPRLDVDAFRKEKGLARSRRLRKFRYLVKARLPVGHFDSDEQFIKLMNDALKYVSRQVQLGAAKQSFSINSEAGIELDKDVDGRVVLKTDYGVAELHLSKLLASLLGFQNQFPMARCTESRRARFPLDSQRGSHNIYVYLEHIDYIHVGHVLAPLLAIIPVSFGRAEDKDRGAVNYEPLHQSWHRLASGRLNTFRVALCNEYGHIVKFSTGSVVLVLHRRAGLPPLL